MPTQKRYEMRLQLVIDLTFDAPDQQTAEQLAEREARLLESDDNWLDGLKKSLPLLADVEVLQVDEI